VPERSAIMIALFVTSIIAAHASSTSTALKVCRPAIARKAEGEIAEISVSRSYEAGATRLVRGQVTIYVGMGPPAKGSASAHHLIRSTYDFSCSVRGKRVRSVTLSQ